MLRHEPHDLVAEAASVHAPPTDASTADADLATATTLKERVYIIGDRIYPLVEALKPGLGAKITGMLLELDIPDLLLLLDSPTALADKVALAERVLVAHYGTLDVPDAAPAVDTNTDTDTDTDTDLSADLATATATQRINILGERLYPLVEARRPDLAPKVTGMLLEKDTEELLRLLESPSELDAAVDGAVQVLEAYLSGCVDGTVVDAKAVADSAITTLMH